MPITKTITLYQIGEVKDDKLYRKIIDRYRNINVEDNDWHDPLIFDKKNDLQKYGFNDVQIRYSGFWSQGDGASFTAKSIDLEKWIETTGFKATAETLSAIKDGDITGAVISNSNFYSHENTVSCDLSYDSPVKGAQLLEQAITADVRERSKAIYKELERLYDDLTTEDSVHDTLEANEYYFNDDGEIDNP